MKKRGMALVIGLVAALGLACMAGCTEEPTLPPQQVYKPAAPAEPFEPGEVVSLWTVEELPAWAEEYNKTAKEKLEEEDLTFTLYDNGYENKLMSAEGETGAYEYMELLGEYALSGSGKLRETPDGIKYIDGDTSLLLVEVDTRVAIGELTGETTILASGLYEMNVRFTLTLYDDHTYLFGNAMSATTLEGTWALEEDGTYMLMGDGLEVTACTPGRRPSITIKSSITGSDGNVYNFEVTVSGLVRNPT